MIKEKNKVTETNPIHDELIRLGFERNQHGDYNITRKQLTLSLDFDYKKIGLVCCGRPDEADISSWRTLLNDYHFENNETVIDVIKRLGMVKSLIDF